MNVLDKLNILLKQGYYSFEELEKQRKIAPTTDELGYIEPIQKNSYKEYYNDWLNDSLEIIYPAKSYFVCLIYSYLMSILTNKPIEEYFFNKLEFVNDPYYSKNIDKHYKQELIEILPKINFNNNMAEIIANYFFEEYGL